MTTTLVTGATGYLGRHLVAELHRRGHTVRAVVRNRSRAEQPGKRESPSLAGLVDEWAIGQLGDESFVADAVSGVSSVVSALGVTTQKADPWDIDYRANLAVLEAAQRNRVDSFCFVNVIGGDRCTAELTKAKTAFALALSGSSISSLIINPPGYFSDMMQVFDMAKRGRVYLFDPERRINPIHGADLAAACVDRLESGEQGNWDIGGPDVFTWRQLAECAFTALEKKPRLTRIPPAALTPIQAIASLVTPRRADTLRFVTWGMLNDSVGEPVGTHHLAEFFAEQANTLSTDRW
ncbi:SDR family oxidoreductase [Actinopolyspora halophila]|uniref:SDR family oxidoreductase n=1 Tax=Actinopolyspora halophila TaxID=1850 RepID=UPI00052536B1|nr:NAD(P)H-binding protein [Actinopolyspora halophila]